MMKKVIVTGATGFIGSALVKRLLLQGVKVYGIDIDMEKLNQMKEYEDFIPIVADFSKYDILQEYFSEGDFDVFFHLAWFGGFTDALRDYRVQLQNAIYSGDAIRAARKIGCKKFVYVGTCNQFEIDNYLSSENLELRYTCIYSTAKSAADLICRTIAYNENIEYCSGLLSMIYGENNRSKQLVNIVLNLLNNGVSPKLIEGNNLYDMVYIDDVVSALIAIGDSGKNQTEYYVGHRSLKKFKEIITDIRDIVAPDVKLKFGEYKDKQNIDYSKIDLNLLYNDTGFECKSDFKESILKTAEWVKSLNWEV